MGYLKTFFKKFRKTQAKRGIPIKKGLDYFTGGQAMPGRTWNGSPDKYRYTHNGHEREDEIFEGAQSAEYWMYDSRIIRRWEVDPIVKPWESPYAAFNNNPILFADPLGLDAKTDYKDSKGNLIAHTDDGLDRTIIIPDENRKAFDIAFAAAEKYGVRNYEPTNRRLGADYGKKEDASVARKIIQAGFLKVAQASINEHNRRSGGEYSKSVDNQSATAFHLFYQWAHGIGPNERVFDENSVMGKELLSTPEVKGAISALIKNPGSEGKYNEIEFRRSLNEEGKLDYVKSFDEDVVKNPTRAFHGSFSGIVKVEKVTQLGNEQKAIDIIITMRDNMTAISGSRLPPPVGYGKNGSVFNQEYPNGFKGPLKTIVIDYKIRTTLTPIKK